MHSIQRPAAPLLTSLALALALPLGSGCHGHRRHHGVVTVPAYAEVEPNDDAFHANDFGVLLPGDLFTIEGFITDDVLFDPLDGFAFTAGAPVHVDFRLFIDNRLADFDVALYDPALDAIIARYQTMSNPETGGVDVLADGVEFHLIVESFQGEGTYSLEIEVYHLPYAARVQGGAALVPTLASAAGAEGESLGSATPLAAERGAAARSDGFDAYRKDGAAPARKRTVVRTVDPETGAVTETTTFEPASSHEE